MFSYFLFLLGMAWFRAVTPCLASDLGGTSESGVASLQRSVGLHVAGDELQQKTSKQASGLAGGVLPIAIESIP